MNPPPDIQERVLKLLGIWPLYDYKAAIERAEKAEAQVKILVEALSDLKSQVDKFCETEGEADFYTGKAEKALAKIKEES